MSHTIRLDLPVLRRHIDQASRMDPFRCAVALAFLEWLPPTYDIKVTGVYAIVTLPEMFGTFRTVAGRLDDETRAHIVAFDHWTSRRPDFPTFTAHMFFQPDKFEALQLVMPEGLLRSYILSNVGERVGIET